MAIIINGTELTQRQEEVIQSLVAREIFNILGKQVECNSNGESILKSSVTQAMKDRGTDAMTIIALAKPGWIEGYVDADESRLFTEPETTS